MNLSFLIQRTLNNLKKCNWNYSFVFVSFSCYAVSIVNKEKPLVVITPSYNNIRWYKKNLDSVFTQQYSNWRMIYIDDCSTDGTASAVEKYVEASHQKHRVQIIKNDTNQGSLYNLYQAIQSCDDNEIIINLDGDDWLSRPDVFQIINQAYENPDVWMTYGQFEFYPSRKLGQCKLLPRYVVISRSYRKDDLITTHLRTFYAGLFKQIKKEDLLYNGNFFRVTGDLAFLYPILEMADGKVKFIDTVLYQYNLANPLNDCRIRCGEQLYYERIIRRKKRYEPLSLERGQKLFSHRDES